MALPAADLRFRNIALRFFAISVHLHTALKHGSDGTGDLYLELHMLAGIGACDLRDGTCKAQVARPMLTLGLEQAAFFHITATIVITVEMRAFFSSRCFHGWIIRA